ncbi:hypothetical protein ACROYT_G032941 [Oculina patagonica]
MKSNSTYREDLHSCVENTEIREGCTNLLFARETDTQPLRVFNKSSFIKLNTMPRESCFVTGTAYVIAGNGNVAWKQFKADKLPFDIHHEDRKKAKHDHFLKWNGNPVPELFGKIVKVDVQCQKPRGRGSDTLSKLCIVFKVKGTVDLTCPVAATPTPTLMKTTVSKTTQVPVFNQTTKEPVTYTDIVIIPIEPNTTTDPSLIDNGKKESHNVGKNAALPIWLIAVVAGGAVIATLFITAIIWLCWKMRKRSNKKRNKSRRQLDNPLYNQEDETVITFAPWDGGTGTNEPGYARVGSPTGQSKGYACLKPPPTKCRSEYQKLLKPAVDHSGYLLPLEAVTATDSPSEPVIYSEAQSPKPEPPQNKPKSKDYDYAKPEGIIVLTASRSSLDNLDSRKVSNLSVSKPNEAGYVEIRDSEPKCPLSPLYAVVEGPNSPKSPGVPPEGAPLENELNDVPADYIEVLPDAENESRDSET